MSTHQLFEVGPGDVALTSDDWYTPRWIFDAAGLQFDMDVCAPVNPAFRTCPAKEYLTVVEDGLVQPWHGLVWCNPPFSAPTRWVEKWAEHGNGLLLVAASRAGWWDGLLARAHALTLLRVAFGSPDGGDWGTYRVMIVLASMGAQASDALSRVGPSFVSVHVRLGAAHNCVCDCHDRDDGCDCGGHPKVG